MPIGPKWNQLFAQRWWRSFGRHRVPETVSFLSEALHDNHPEVWKSALDGFVALGNPSAIQILESAKHQIQGTNVIRSLRIDWINEAIQQIRNGSFAWRIKSLTRRFQPTSRQKRRRAAEPGVLGIGTPAWSKIGREK